MTTTSSGEGPGGPSSTRISSSSSLQNGTKVNPFVTSEQHMNFQQQLLQLKQQQQIQQQLLLQHFQQQQQQLAEEHEKQLQERIRVCLV